MSANFSMPRNAIAGLIAILLIVIIILLASDMTHRDRSIGDKVNDAVEELQK